MTRLILAAFLSFLPGYSFACDLSDLNISGEEKALFNDYESELLFLKGTAPKDFHSLEAQYRSLQFKWEVLHVVCGNKALALVPFKTSGLLASGIGSFDNRSDLKPLLQFAKTKNYLKMALIVTDLPGGMTSDSALLIYRADLPAVAHVAQYLIQAKSDPRISSGTQPELYLQGMIYGYQPNNIGRYIFQCVLQTKEIPSDLVAEAERGVSSWARSALQILRGIAKDESIDASFFESGFKKFGEF